MISTTALSDVGECAGRKKRRRSIDDTPSHEVNIGGIAPSSSTAVAGNSDREAELQAAGVSTAASNLARRQHLFYQTIGALIQ